MTKPIESKRVFFLTLDTYRRAGSRNRIHTGLRMDDATKLLSHSAGNRTCHLSGFRQCSAHFSYASGLSSDKSSPPTNTNPPKVLAIFATIEVSCNRLHPLIICDSKNCGRHKGCACYFNVSQLWRPRQFAERHNGRGSGCCQANL